MRAKLLAAALLALVPLIHAPPARCTSCNQTRCVVNSTSCGPNCTCAQQNLGDTQGVCVVVQRQRTEPSMPAPYLPRRSSSPLMDALRHVTEQNRR